ncbi:hypothetical protein L21SP5_02366 [Salinivirga cyanobacteriivorans]|uniref:Lipocalin-like domain-containing protein n=1 Tax=Salinivirga cyanobacteriivorans TaxID=1307839 RepID=A0A0S2I120_9BACT|nr:hypothetical protein [Salinivirga cyanobacteriivorans]ALO15997.1 hypothetical protein L21SP5_02366 [Salinivirga cyanobacteriivorans]
MRKFWPVLIITLIFFSSCVDRKTSFLIGKWEEVPRVVEPSRFYIWTFKDDNNFTIETYAIDSTDGEPMAVNEGEYNLDRKSMEFRLTLELKQDMGGHPVNGEWWVDELDRTIFKMTRESADSDGNPFVRYEFVKL